MNQKHWHPTDAEQAIAQQLETFQGKAARIWWGNEKEAVITLVRALDTSANIHMQGIGSNRFISLGTAAALRPFLSRLENQPSSLKWKSMARGRGIIIQKLHGHPCQVQRSLWTAKLFFHNAQ